MAGESALSGSMQEFCVGLGRGNSRVGTRDYLIVTPQGSDQGMVVAYDASFSGPRAG
jgi:hypothetical protein